MVAVSIHRRWRHRVDRIEADQLVDVKDVAVGLVLCPGAGPQEPLRLAALLREALPALVRIDLLVELIGELGVGNRHLAFKRVQLCFFGRIRRRGDFFVDLVVDERVDAADEETCYAGNLMRVAALLGESFEPRNIGLGNLRIDLLRKQQRHIDVYRFGDQRIIVIAVADRLFENRRVRRHPA